MMTQLVPLLLLTVVMAVACQSAVAQGSTTPTTCVVEPTKGAGCTAASENSGCGLQVPQPGGGTAYQGTCISGKKAGADYVCNCLNSSGNVVSGGQPVSTSASGAATSGAATPGAGTPGTTTTGSSKSTILAVGAVIVVVVVVIVLLFTRK